MARPQDRTARAGSRRPTRAPRVAATADAYGLAREAANPFGRKVAAGVLLERFGGAGDDEERRDRTAAALELVGLVADPPLSVAEPHQLVHLRLAAPYAAPADQADPVRVGVRAPVPTRGQVRAGALGLLALVVVVAAAMLLRSVAGDGGARISELPAGTQPTTSAASAPPRTTPAGAPPTRSAKRRTKRSRLATTPIPPRRALELRMTPPPRGAPRLGTRRTTPRRPARRPAALTPGR